jgi:release factor glutamine methyltransferase
VLDVGCGSGAIGLALLDMLPNAHCVGVDVSEEAVALSLHNAVKLGLQARYTCLKTSIKDMSTEHPDMLGRFYLVVSNPPYIPSQEMLNLENELRFEDVRALYGGEDGLDIIKQIIFAAPELLSADGAREVWMEVSHTHPEELEKRFRYGSLGSRINALEWFRDLSGRPRIVKLRMS